MRVCVIQLNASGNKALNLEQATHWLEKAYRETKPDLIVLPEMFSVLGGSSSLRQSCADFSETITQAGSDTYRLLQNFAQQHSVYLHAGSVCEKHDNSYFNTSFVFDRSGNCVAQYRKIHLFNATTPSGVVYHESDSYCSGDRIVTYHADGIVVGCSICYDIRFGELFRALRQREAKLIVIPAAFAYETGRSHWEILVRARAIETQCYIAAAAQTGSFVEGDGVRSNWGHSMIVNPWGEVIAALQEEVGYLTAEVDFAFLEAVRRRLPVHEHHRLPSSSH